MKSYYSFLIISIMLICFSPSSSFGDIITKDGVKIQFFKKGQKKSISKQDMTNTDGTFEITSMEDECLEKIVFTNTKDNPPTFSIKIYNSSNQLLLRKDEIYVWDKKKGFTLPIYPWLNEQGSFQDYQSNETNLLGKYKIQIESKNGDKVENVVSLTYSIFEHWGD